MATETGPTAKDSPRSRPRGTTRERILAAALDLFIERGVDGTAVSDIERAVGLAAGTGSFYRHFRSKEDVLVASVQRGAAELLHEIEIAGSGLPREQDPLKRRMQRYQLLLNAMQRFEPLWRLIVAEGHRVRDLEQTFTAALDVRGWDFNIDDDPAEAVALAALTGYAQLSLLHEGPYRAMAPEDFVAALIKMTSKEL